jgi:hypothetical protein
MRLDSTTDLVTLSGSRTLTESSGETLTLESVIITNGSTIVAKDLRIGSWLALTGQSTFSAAEDKPIAFEAKTKISLIAEGGALPKIYIGAMAGYIIVPALIVVDMKDVGTASGEPFRAEVLTGDDWADCNEWALKVSPSSEIKVKARCETVSTIDSWQVRGLLWSLRRHPEVRDRTRVRTRVQLWEVSSVVLSSTS